MKRFEIYLKLKNLKSNIYDVKHISKNKITNLNTNKVHECPYCHDKNFIKYGKTNGIQRFRCKNSNCRKTFNEENYSPFKYSKKFKYMWREYLELMNEGLSIRECALHLKINIITAFFWRHRILNSLTSVPSPSEFKTQVEMTNMIHHESFKGCKTTFPKIREIINVVSIVDAKYSVESVLLSRNTIRMNTLIEKIYPKIHKDALIIAYQDSRLKNFAKKHNANLGLSYDVRTKRIISILNKNIIKKSIIEKINNTTPIEPAFSIKLKLWFMKFRGVATKYIDHYLKWYTDLYIFNNVNTNLMHNKISTYLRWIDIRKRVAVI